MKNALRDLIVMSLMLAGLSAPAFAQSEGLDNQFRLQTFYTADADFDMNGDTGSFSVFGGQADLEFGWLVTDYIFRRYEWSDVDRLPFGDGASDPWEELHKAAVGISHDDMWSEKVGYFFAAEVSTAFEEEMDDSFGARGWGGFIYRMPLWNLGFRLGALYDWNEVKSTVLPIVGIAWKNPGVKGFSAMVGIPLTAATYRFSDRWAVQAGVAFDSDTFRLADDSPVSPEGYLETQDIGGEIALLYTLSENLRLRAAVGGFFDRSLTIYDPDGNNGEEYDIDPGAFGRVALSVAF